MNIVGQYTEFLSRYFPSIAIGLGALLAVGFLIYLVRQAGKHSKPKTESSPKETTPNVDEEVQKILNAAREQASEIVSNAEAFKKTLDDEAKRILEESLKQDAKILHEKAEELSTQYKNFFAKMQTDYFRQVQETLQQGRITIEKYLQEKIDEELGQAKRQIEEYRASQIKKIEELTIPAVSKIAKDVLGKSLSISDHREIITNALEKAKREGLFDF